MAKPERDAVTKETQTNKFSETQPGSLVLHANVILPHVHLYIYMEQCLQFSIRTHWYFILLIGGKQFLISDVVTCPLDPPEYLTKHPRLKRE
jgi:hypothetical protein